MYQQEIKHEYLAGTGNYSDHNVEFSDLFMADALQNVTYHKKSSLERCKELSIKRIGEDWNIFCSQETMRESNGPMMSIFERKEVFFVALLGYQDKTPLFNKSAPISDRTALLSMGVKESYSTLLLFFYRRVKVKNSCETS